MRRRPFVLGLSAAALLSAGGGVALWTSSQTRYRMRRIGVLSNDEHLRLKLDECSRVFEHAIRIELGEPPLDADVFALDPAERPQLFSKHIPPRRIGRRSTAISAAREHTRTIPIVFLGTADPLASGLVTSLARPGGNLTGVTSVVDNAAAPAKRLELLKGAVPRIRRVGALLWTGNPIIEDQRKSAQAAADVLDIQLESFPVRVADDLDPALDATVRAGAEGLLTAGGGPGGVLSGTRIAAFAAEHHLPAIHQERGFVEVGGLLAYGPNLVAQTRRSAAYVDKLLRGAKPGDLPVERISEPEFVVNARTVRALGLTLSPDVAAQVTEWIG